jgi:ethanolamine utilization protein EutA
MDIGGGTSNLSYIENGNITATGCLNVGGRLVKLDVQGKITYISPVLEGLTDLSVGETPTQAQLRQLTDILTQALMMAAGLIPPTELLCKLTTRENTGLWTPKKAEVLSFSGGVADCIEKEQDIGAFGDLGVLLGQSIRKSDLCSGQYRLGEQTIRATVIGAGCHSARLSGSTVFYDGVELPQKNLPVVALPMPPTEEQVKKAYLGQDSATVVLALKGDISPTYQQVQALAKTLVAGSENKELLVCTETDMAKALGHSIRLIAPQRPCLCIDRVQLQNESFLDIGKPVGPALPVVIKTLILSQ